MSLIFLDCLGYFIDRLLLFMELDDLDDISCRSVARKRWRKRCFAHCLQKSYRARAQKTVCILFIVFAEQKCARFWAKLQPEKTAWLTYKHRCFFGSRVVVVGPRHCSHPYLAAGFVSGQCEECSKLWGPFWAQEPAQYQPFWSNFQILRWRDDHLKAPHYYSSVLKNSCFRMRESGFFLGWEVTTLIPVLTSGERREATIVLWKRPLIFPRLQVLTQGLSGIIVGIVTQLVWKPRYAKISWKSLDLWLKLSKAGGVRKVMATICGLILTCLPGKLRPFALFHNFSPKMVISRLQQILLGMHLSWSVLAAVPLVAGGIYLHVTWSWRVGQRS